MKSNLAALLFLGACTTIVAPSNPHQAWCDHNAPHNYSAQTLDTFTRAEIDAENTYQDQGIKWCGWKS